MPIPWPRTAQDRRNGGSVSLPDGYPASAAALGEPPRWRQAWPCRRRTWRFPRSAPRVRPRRTRVPRAARPAGPSSPGWSAVAVAIRQRGRRPHRGRRGACRSRLRRRETPPSAHRRRTSGRARRPRTHPRQTPHQTSAHPGTSYRRAGRRRLCCLLTAEEPRAGRSRRGRAERQATGRRLACRPPDWGRVRPDGRLRRAQRPTRRSGAHRRRAQARQSHAETGERGRGRIGAGRGCIGAALVRRRSRSAAA